MNKEPLVTVLMACFNAERWLAESVISVLNQSYARFEFLIVNDGSSDDTLAQLEEFGRRDSRIRIIDKKNSGTADSLNIGLAQAKGTWIARLDADDVADPLRLEKQVQHVLENPRVVLLGTGLVEINEDGEKVRMHGYPRKNGRLVRRLRRSQAVFPHSSAFYRARTARSLGGYCTRLRLCEDRDLWLRLSECGDVACLPLPLVQVRRHAAQISHSEGGMRQKIEHHAAVASHFLRGLREYDPIHGTDENAARVFLNWIEQELLSSDFFEKRRAWDAARSEFFGEARVAVRAVRLAIRLSRFGGEFAFLTDKIWGSDLSRQLALKWSQGVGPLHPRSVTKRVNTPGVQ